MTAPAAAPALEQLLETSLAAWLADASSHSISLSGYAIRHDQEDGSDLLPTQAIIIKGTRLDEEVGTGVWRCQLAATLVTDATEVSDADRIATWGKVVSLLTWADLPTELAVANQLHVYAVRYPNGTDREIRGTQHLSTFALDCWACTIAPAEDPA